VNCLPANDGNHGILFNTGEKLRFRNGTIRGTTGNACAIYFQPNTNAELHVDDAVISENGTTGGGGGICIVPRSNADVLSVVKKTFLQNNRYGLRTSSAGAGQIIDVLIQQSVIAGNPFGVRSSGAASNVRMHGNAIYGNSMALNTTNGGKLTTLGGNVLRANGTNGAFTDSEVTE
jgi:hypothetical protein